MILRRLFEGRQSGFYVDVGAHHPRRFSNTYHFYRMGWLGINIDAMPGSMSLFRRLRGRDINLEIAVGKEKELLSFYCFNEPALNTFERDLAMARNRGPHKIVREELLQTNPLKEILARYLPSGQMIDFLSVDVEGRDLDVLRSNDWKRFRARVVMAESTGESLETVKENEIYKYMQQQHYRLWAKTANTLLLMDGDWNGLAV